MCNETLLIAAVFVPLIGGLFLPLVGRLSSRLRNYLALIFILTPLVFSLRLIPEALAGNILTVSKNFPLGFNFILRADCLAVFMAVVSSFISSVIVLYSFTYISHYENQSEYYLMVSLFVGAMMGLVYSANLIFLYLFWEITAITSWRLIGFFREEAYVFKANKAFLVTVFGALVMLLGFILLYQQTGSFDLAVIKTVLRNNPVPNIVIILILFGIFSKSATLPFQTWLPDAGVAPSPVTALLHAAVLVKIGVYVYARLFVATFTTAQVWHTVVPLIAGASALISAGAALIDKDIKRIIAFSTISQIGFIFLGFSINSEIGIAGALLFILMHGLAKGGLFLCAGIVEQNTKVKDITKLGGLIKTMPLTAIAFILCSFSIIGVPPFGGFFSKYMVMAGAFESGHLIIAIMFLSCAFLTIIYLFRVFNAVFLGEPQTALVKERSTTMVVCVFALGVLSLLAGIFISYPGKFVLAAVKQMIGI